MSLAAPPRRHERVGRASFGLLAAFVAFVAVGCSGRQEAEDPRPLVLVTVPPQADLVERVAGELVRIETLLAGSSDPHHHEPTLENLRALSAADLWVKVGHPDFSFERAFIDRLMAQAPEVELIDASEGVESRPGDPHVWVSPRHAATLARRLSASLERRLPEHAAELGGRLDAFLAELEALEVELKATLAPARGRWFLVVHPAWGYLAAEHGLEQVAIEPDGREPDPRTLAALIARARSARLPVIFVEPQFDDVGARTIAAEIGAKVVALDPLARNWSENLRVVARALAEGSVP